MSPTKAEKEEQQRQEQRKEVLEKGRFASTEGDDNAVATSDDQFVGVSEEYREYAYPVDEPLEGEYKDKNDPEKLAFDRVKQREAELAETNKKVGFRGYSPDTPHPSQGRNPADDYINKNRAALDNAAAQQQADSQADENKEDGSADSGSGGDQG